MDLIDTHALGDRVRVDAVEIKRFGNAANLRQFRDAQTKVVVLGALKTLVDAADLIKDRPPDEPEMEGHEIEKHAVF